MCVGVSEGDSEAVWLSVLDGLRVWLFEPDRLDVPVALDVPVTLALRVKLALEEAVDAWLIVYVELLVPVADTLCD